MPTNPNAAAAGNPLPDNPAAGPFGQGGAALDAGTGAGAALDAGSGAALDAGAPVRRGDLGVPGAAAPQAGNVTMAPAPGMATAPQSAPVAPPEQATPRPRMVTPGGFVVPAPYGAADQSTTSGGGASMGGGAPGYTISPSGVPIFSGAADAGGDNSTLSGAGPNVGSGPEVGSGPNVGSGPQVGSGPNVGAGPEVGADAGARAPY
jgi:hypothetical protein